MKKIIIVLLAALFFFTQCKREKDKDHITQHDIKGMVYNNCTDSGLANVTVYLKDGQGLDVNTVSDGGGNFVFPGVSIHDNSKYTYSIYIPSKSGDNATTFEYCRFIGASLSFNHDEADMNFKPRVEPGCLLYTIYTNPTPITNSSDSVIYTAYQNTLHKNNSIATYTWGGGGQGTGVSWDNYGGYPMGKQVFQIDIWRSGVHTTKKDSIYLTWGANKTYTINW